MTKTVRYHFALIALFMIFSSNIQASEGHHHFTGDPISTMANIVIGLKHFPSKEEKGQLKDLIAHTEDQNIKTIATALVNMRHSASDEDKAKLEKVMNDSNTSTNIKLLAKVIHDINHKPSRDDKEALAQLTQH